MTENENINLESSKRKQDEAAMDAASGELSPEMQERWARRTPHVESQQQDSSGEDGDSSPRVPLHKRPFFRKLCYALLSLAIALTIWGYVLMSENPARIKRIEHVRLSFEGGSEADLKSRNLVVTGDMSTVLPEVSVSVRTYLNDLPRFNNTIGEVVSATVNLNDIREPGTYQLRVTPSTVIGTVYSVEPATVTVNIENYVTRSIPVTCSFVNSLPEGYWREEQPHLEWSNISVSGPESVINSIVQASCVIDLANRTESINESFDVILLDGDQNIVDPANLVVSARYMTVRMSILPYIDISLKDYINEVGTLSDDYEITNIDINPSFISVAAPQSVLDELEDSISLEPINLEELTSGVNTMTVSLVGLPAGATALTDNNFIITVDVADKIIERSFTLELEDGGVIGKNSDHVYSFSTRTFSVILNGPSATLNAIRESDLSLSLDVSGFMVGPHGARPTLTVKDEPEWSYDGSVTIRISTTVCTVTNGIPAD